MNFEEITWNQAIEEAFVSSNLSSNVSFRVRIAEFKQVSKICWTSNIYKIFDILTKPFWNLWDFPIVYGKKEFNIKLDQKNAYPVFLDQSENSKAS